MTGVVEAVLPVLMVAVAAGGAVAIARHRLPGAPGPVPAGRPLEDIAADVRRISVRFHQQGMRFAKYEGYRRSYDQVLAEAADTLEIGHLIGVLSPGAELDHERARIERRLAEVGMLPDAA